MTTEPPGTGSPQLLGRSVRRVDYLITFVSEFAVLASGLLVLRLAANYWGAAGFGEYVVLRRSLALLQLPLLCNMGVAVSRYVAISQARASGSSVRDYFDGALLVTACGAVAATLVSAVAAGPLAELLFGNGAYASLSRAAGFALPGLLFHGVTYGYLRGMLALKAANLLQFTNLGLVPAAVLLVPGLSVAASVTAMGSCWLAVSLVAIGASLARAGGRQASFALRPVTELLRYGLPRVPGEFALAALFSLPVTIAAHRGGPASAGMLGLGLSLLSMVGSMFAPLGQVLLPTASRWASEPLRDDLEREVRSVLLWCSAIALVMASVLAVSARGLILWYVGMAFAPAVPIARVLLVAAVPFVWYVVLRNVLDALDVRALNARNLVVALVVLVSGSVAGGKSLAPYAVVAGVWCLGLLTVRDAWRLLRTRRTIEDGRSDASTWLWLFR